MTAAELRAQRLIRCYPRVWRERYGDEFVALLVDDLADQPRSLRWDIGVVRAGLSARLSACGLTRGPVRDRSSAMTLAIAAAVCFVASTLSIWTQLADGWLTARPDAHGVAVSLVTLSVGLGGLFAVSALLGLRMVVAVLQTFGAGGGRLLVRPLMALASSGAVLVSGLLLIRVTSPGAQVGRGHDALGHAAGIGWAATQTISTFWLHPHRLLALPAADITWMLICPAGVAMACWSVARLVCITGPHTRRTRWPASWVANVLFLPCLAAAAVWVIGSQHAADATYRAGTLDLLLIAAMAAASCGFYRAAALWHQPCAT